MSKTTTDAHQRERNRVKMAAYRARNPEKTREHSRVSLQKLRERRKAEGIPRTTYYIPRPREPKPVAVAKPIQPQKPVVNARIALIRERQLALRAMKIIQTTPSQNDY